MTKYTVHSVRIAPLERVHDGTGQHQRSASAATGFVWYMKEPLQFSRITAKFEAMCFDLSEHVVPRRFAVAVSSGAHADAFTRAHIFFHPNPNNAGMPDAAYPDGAHWPRLYRYMQIIGTQMVAASTRQRVLIMPYMTGATSYTTGVLATDWQEIVVAVLNAAKASILPGDKTEVAIQEVTVSSFCYGIRYSDSFRRLAGHRLRSILRGVWDFDGKYSSEHGASANLHADGGNIIRYDQHDVPYRGLDIHVPPRRWTQILHPPSKNPPTKNDFDRVHQLIPGTLFSHACRAANY